MSNIERTDSNVNHDETSNRNHNTDDLSPNAIDANTVNADTLEATTSITDPEGNTVTSLSDPVRVTEEASTFAESDVTVTHNDTIVSNGSIELGFKDGTIASRPNDNGSLNPIDDSLGLRIEPQSDISGVRVTVSSNTTSIQDVALTDKLGSTILDETTGGFTGGDTVDLIAPLSANTQYNVLTWNDGDTYTPGTYDAPSFPYTSTDVDIIETALRFHPDDPSGSSSTTTNTAYTIKDVTALSGDATSGDALVEWDSAAPTDIQSYDLATFQRTLDNETVTIDVEDAAGNVLFSDIGRDFDISTVDTTKEVKLRANLSRTNTANNPTVDYLARRFTR